MSAEQVDYETKVASMNVAVVSGFWGQNIGNAFFNLGGRHVLEAAGIQVSFIQDMPAYATFRNERRGNFTNHFPILDNLDVDCVVLQGPLFTKNFGQIWSDQLKRLTDDGVRWAVLGGAFRKYSSEEESIARDVIDSCPPLFVSTRDDVTADRLRGIPSVLRSGIDSAFFVPEAFDAPRFRRPVVSMCFDHYGEPEICPDSDGMISLGEVNFDLSWNRFVDRAASMSKAHATAAHALQRRNRAQDEVCGYQIVRPEHRTNPHLPFKIYRNSNGLASDEPWSYLTVYANSVLTVSDRVHACVATLAYGGRAFLHNPATRRDALFDSIGAGEVGSRDTCIDQDIRLKHYRDVVDFCRGELG